MLKITKSTDPVLVDQLIACLYSPPGIGKTSLGFTGHDPLLLDFDAGVYRAANRGDSVAVKAWDDVAAIAADDLKQYKTIVVDTAGRALDALSADIIRRDPKLGRAGALTLQGYGRLKADFAAWLKLLRSFGADVVLLAHSDEQRNGDDTIERIDAQGSSKNEIYKCSDAMGRLTLRNGKRFLLFSPSDTAFGKNPAGFEPLDVPTFNAHSRFLGEVLDKIKAKLNATSEEQSEVATALTEWSEMVAKATTADKMNGLLKSLDKIDERAKDTAKRALWAHAKEHGFDFDKTAKVFTEPSEVA